MRVVPPVFGPALAEFLVANDEPKPTAMGTRMRYSDAAACAFKLGLVAAGIPPSDDFDLASAHVASIGTIGHDKWQRALQWRFPEFNWQMEKPSIIEEADMSGSSDAHGVHRGDGHKVDLELKHMGGFAWRMASGMPDKGTTMKTGSGPRESAVVQGALNGYANDADEVRWPLLSYEAISVGRGRQMQLAPPERFVSEWSMERAEFVPIAEAEVDRVIKVLECVDDSGVLPDRVVPKWTRTKGYDAYGQMIPDSTKSRYWGCDYCSHQSLCHELPQGDGVEVPVDLAVAKATQNGWITQPEEAA